jgi:hypothetical protein
MVLLVLQELLVHLMELKQHALSDQMEFHVSFLTQLVPLQELNHAEQKNVQISLEPVMIYALDKLLVKHVFQMERYV